MPDPERLHRKLQRQVQGRVLERAMMAEITRCRRDYNEVQPHSSLGRISPASFATLHRQRAGDARQSPEIK
ncbi:integrase core domain-containing protein [Delftia tsuruhatensis]|uniref:integrase core domain-containing protein n=1 Tax=Delftia tsuruhatensis TaxID=180282 RepID=UPI00338DEBBC